ncbi:MAG: hypothetical protein OXE46_11090 [Chloroflexi bacterium]|nr:hypothetical protein [Chloroflexota bacterium]
MAARTNAEDNFVHETGNRQVEQIAKLEASQEHMATKADIESLRADMEKLKSDLTWRIVIAMSIMTAIFTAIVRLPAAGA